MVGVLVVAQRPAVRAGLAALLAAEDEIRVTGQVASVAGGFESERDLPPECDALLIDPEGGAPELEEIVAVFPGLPLVILGPVSDDLRLVRSLNGRPWAYLPREAGGDRIASALRAVAAGLVVIDPALAGRVIGSGMLDSAMEPQSDELTPREREVLQLIALGLPNKIIANRLAISEHTVKFHVASILARLGAATRTEAVRLGARRGLVVL